MKLIVARLNRESHTLSSVCRGLKLLAVVILSLLLCSCHASKNKRHHNKPKVETVRTGNLKGIEKKVVDEALSWLGTPYKYAGSQKGKGSDCSGMVMGTYEKATGIKLPRNSRQQAEFCKKINKNSVKPGDLVFFATGKDPSVISHVGIMIDDVRFVHASTKKGVIISEVNTPYYQRTFKMYGRVPR